MTDAYDGIGHSTGERLVKRLATLSAARRVLVAECLKGAPPRMAGPRGVRREEGRVASPLSFAQERLWFLENLAPGSAAHNVAGAVRLTGPLDVDALFWSLRQLTMRHDILRTVVPSVEGRPMQVICSGAGPVPRTRDLCRLQRPERERAIARLIAEEAGQPFNLGLGPLWRATLFTLGSDEHVLAVTLHHIIADAWSVRILVDELLRFYGARTTGSEAALDELPFQYADYAVWQRTRVAEGAMRDGLEFWKRHLGTKRSPWECPVDHPRLGVPSFRASVETRTLSPALAGRLAALSVQAKATPFMVFLATFNVVLSRWGESRDICVLTPVANRVDPGVEHCAGFFVNVLPLRTYVDPDATFAELIENVRRCTLHAYANQHVPFEQLLTALGVKRRIDHAPLSTVAFTLEAERAESWQIGPLAVELEEIQRHTVETDLLLVVCQGQGGITARAEYRCELFEPETIGRLLDEYEGALRWLLYHPERRLSELRGEGGRRVARKTASEQTVAREAEPQISGSVTERFEAHVRNAPEKTAVASASAGRLSYAELHAEATRFAAALRCRGARVETLVAVLGRRSPEYVATILGVLDAGSAFLPIDPELPAKRIEQILRQSGAELLVVDEASVSLVPQFSTNACGRPDVLMPRDVPRQAAPCSEGVKNGSRDLAYVVFTSGSTGVPKGAMIEHGGMLNHLRAKISLLGLTAGDRIAQTASQSFDISIWQWCAPLLVGATVEILDDDDVRDPQRLATQLESRAVSIVEIVPSMLRLLLDEVEAAGPSRPHFGALRTLVVTGEPLAPALCRRWLHLYPRVPLINAYGPTECADDVTHFEVRVPPPPAQLRVPIGQAIENVRLYIDDGTLVPAAPGCAGELCVAGAAVGRGYVNDPERTDGAFARDPLSDDPTARMYRTGDLVQVLADGNLDVLGRRDQQVKVAGCRVEPSEIEATLKCIPEVRDAAVVAEDGEDGLVRLSAYVVPARTEAPSVRELKQFLAERLPERMVPSRFVEVEALPLTANMKLDRAALTESGAGRPSAGDREKPRRRSRVEELLAEIWQEVLGLKAIGVDENFFELGGDSILSIRVSAKARRVGLGVAAKDIFEHPTIARLAKAARWQRRGTAEQDLIVGPVALTPPQRGFFEQSPLSPDLYAMSTLLEVRPELDPLLLMAAVERLVLHHDALRLRFRRCGDQWRQEHASPGGVVAVRCVNFRGSGKRALGRAVRAVDAELRRSLSLSAGPLVALAKIEGGRRHESVLSMVAHHLVCDTVSAHILLEDLDTAYAQLALGLQVSLPPKTTSFRDWSNHLIAYARSAECLAEIPYWLGQVATGACGLPVDRQDGANGDGLLRTTSVWLEADATAALIHVAALRQQTTARDLLLGAFLHAIAPWLGARSLVLHLEGHARVQLCPGVDLSRTVGWFATGYPVKLDASAARSTREAVEHVGHVLRGVPRDGLGFGVLRHLSRDPRVAPLQSAPVPEVRFNYIGVVDPGCGRSRLFKRVRTPVSARTVVFAKCAHVLEITLVVIDGRLHVTAEYSKSRLRRTTIERVLAAFIASLRRVASAGGHLVHAADDRVSGDAEARASWVHG